MQRPFSQNPQEPSAPFSQNFYPQQGTGVMPAPPLYYPQQTFYGANFQPQQPYGYGAPSSSNGAYPQQQVYQQGPPPQQQPLPPYYQQQPLPPYYGFQQQQLPLPPYQQQPYQQQPQAAYYPNVVPPYQQEQLPNNSQQISQGM